MTGKILIYTTTILFFLSTLFYVISLYNKHEKIIKLARTFFFGGGFAVVFVSAIFLGEILANNFQYTYIYNFSSKDLPKFLLISTFWAGQEGSFLLWLLCLTILTFIFLPIFRQNDFERYTIPFISLILFFLSLMLILKSPFEYLWETYKDMGIPKGTMPQDGRGLNPILENFWITIHPPILFLGYAGMAFPWILASANILKNNNDKLINLSLSLTLFSSFLLGAGIMLGGVWAYETLGWGGFWGWDPVENSSLIPWMVSLVLIHTLNIQKRTGKLIKTNYFLALFSFLLVLYSTFLTRSGILSDISVHSFVDPGKTTYNVLLAFIFIFLAIGIGIFILKYKSLPNTRTKQNILSREFWIITGSVLLLISAWIIFLGTSYPIILKILNQPQNAVETKFYNDWNFPIAILILLTIGISYFLSWGTQDRKTFINKIIIFSLLSLIITVIISIIFNIELQNSIFIFSALFCFTTSINEIVKIFKSNFFLIGGVLSHIGIIFILVGALISGTFTTKEVINLEEKIPFKALNYQFIFENKEKITPPSKKKEEYIYNITLSQNNIIDTLKPVVLWSDFNEFKAPFFRPAIKSNFFYDLYISPKAIEPEIKFHIDTIKLNETKQIMLEDTLYLTLKDLETIEHSFSKQMSNSAIYKAPIELNYKNRLKLDTLYILYNRESRFQETYWINIENSTYKIGLTDIYFDNDEPKFAKISFSKELFIIEADIKPLISFVWIGTILSLIGLLLSIIKHLKYRQKNTNL